MSAVLTPAPGLEFAPQLACDCGAKLTVAGFHPKPRHGLAGDSHQEYVCHACGRLVRPKDLPPDTMRPALAKE